MQAREHRVAFLKSIMDDYDEGVVSSLVGFETRLPSLPEGNEIWVPRYQQRLIKPPVTGVKRGLVEDDVEAGPSRVPSYPGSARATRRGRSRRRSVARSPGEKERMKRR